MFTLWTGWKSLDNIQAQMVNPPSANVKPASIIFNQEKEVLEKKYKMFSFIF